MSSTNPFLVPAAPPAGQSTSVPFEKPLGGKGESRESFEDLYDRASAMRESEAPREKRAASQSKEHHQARDDEGPTRESEVRTKSARSSGAAREESVSRQHSEPDRSTNADSRRQSSEPENTSDIVKDGKAVSKKATATKEVPTKALDGTKTQTTTPSEGTPPPVATAGPSTPRTTQPAQGKATAGTSGVEKGGQTVSSSVTTTEGAPVKTSAATKTQTLAPSGGSQTLQPKTPTNSASVNPLPTPEKAAAQGTTTNTQPTKVAQPAGIPISASPSTVPAQSVPSQPASVAGSGEGVAAKLGGASVAAQAAQVAAAPGSVDQPLVPVATDSLKPEQQTATMAQVSADAGKKVSSKAEKTAGARNSAAVVAGLEKQKNFLNTDSKQVKEVDKDSGINPALGNYKMKPPFPKPLAVHGPSGTRLPVSQGTGVTVEGVNFSVSWKGWTNGGGERGSTAAQFSRLAEGMPTAQHTFTGSPSLTNLRAPSPVASPAAAVPVVPANDSSIVGPIGTAIERLVTRGQDQVSLTVRFENGGKVSIQVAMQGGEIATKIHTDVPGLESNLRSSWGQLANEWENRGWKLSTPSFSTGADGNGNEQGRNDARHADRDADGSFAPRGRQGNSHWSGRSPRQSSTTASAQEDVGASAPQETTGLDRGALKTWA